MQIEGTPNERALLVALAYIAGFTSAFIAFGVATGAVNMPSGTTVMNHANQAASIQTSVQSAEEAAVEVTEPSADITLVYENSRLYLHTGAEFPTLLSIHADVAGVVYEENDLLEVKQGFHSALPYYDHITPLGHVFYCEQYASTGMCTPYIYDVESQNLHVMVVDGQHLQVDNREARQVTVTSMGSYVVGNYRSVSSATPWEMIER